MTGLLDEDDKSVGLDETFIRNECRRCGAIFPIFSRFLTIRPVLSGTRMPCFWKNTAASLGPFGPRRYG
jgi:hypothetical protein